MTEEVANAPTIAGEGKVINRMIIFSQEELWVSETKISFRRFLTLHLYTKVSYMELNSLGIIHF